MIDGTLVTAERRGACVDVDRVDVRDPLTLVVHMKRPDNALLFNLSDGLFGVVERGAGKDEGLHPVGTGPFKFVSQAQDKEVVVERNADYWAGAPRSRARAVCGGAGHDHERAGVEEGLGRMWSPT